MTHLDWNDPRFERLPLPLVMTNPTVYGPDGLREGLTTFRTFVTDVHDPSLPEEHDADGFDKSIIGSIGGGVGFLTIFDRRTGKEWMVRHDEIWHAYCKAAGVPDPTVEVK